MLNKNPNAIVTLTNLSPDYFVQGDDGKISLKPDMDLSISKSIRYAPGAAAGTYADAHHGFIELVDNTDGMGMFAIHVNNHYDSTGEYLGSTVATKQGALV